MNSSGVDAGDGGNGGGDIARRPASDRDGDFGGQKSVVGLFPSVDTAIRLR